MEKKVSYFRKYLTLLRIFFKEFRNQKEAIIEGINALFSKWSNFAYNHPYTLIVITLIFCCACGLGLIRGMSRWIDGAENLYSLPYSQARDSRTLHHSYFGDAGTRKNVVIVKHKNQGENILTWNYLEEIKLLNEIVQGREIDPKGNRKIVIPKSTGSKNGSTKKQMNNNDTLSNDESPNRLIINNYVSFEDICAATPWGDCHSESILNMGLDEYRDLGILKNDPELYVFNGFIFNRKKNAFVPEYFLGGAEKVPCVRDIDEYVARKLLSPDKLKPSNKTGFLSAKIECIFKVEAFLMLYSENHPHNIEWHNAWEQVFIQVMKENLNFGDLRLSFQAFRSRDDELKSSTAESHDVVFVIFTFVILIAYSSALNFSCDLYRSKAYAAFAGAGAALMGLIAGMGIVSLTGLSMVPTVLISPFLVMGIGVDDMFVIINSYSLSYMVQSAQDRCAVALRDCGVSITITTLTNLIAFAVGAFSPYTSIRNFCIYSAASLFLGYFFALTFFFPFLCLDAKREKCAKACLFCLPKYTNKQKSVAQNKKDVEKRFQEMSTYSLVTYKVRVNNDEKAQRSTMSFASGNKGELSTRSLNPANKNSGSYSYEYPNEVYDGATGLGHEASRKKSSEFQGSPLEYNISDSMSILKIALPHHENRDIMECNNNQSGPSLSSITGVSRAKPERSSRSVGSGSSLATALAIYDPVLARQTIYEEPRGNVGRKWRVFFLNYYGPFLMLPFIKVLVIFIFIALFSVSILGFMKLQQGLNITELAPSSSYLRVFDSDIDKYFSKFDQPTDVFFPDAIHWWKPEIQNSLRILDNRLANQSTTAVIINPLLKMLDDEEIGPKLKSGDKNIFETTLKQHLMDDDSEYKQFEFDFAWSGKELLTWKLKVLPVYMRTSEERASWMQQIRKDCESSLSHGMSLPAIPYNFMMIFYESDLEILSSVVLNMIVAAVAMLLVAFVLIPQLTAALLVIFTILLIDVALFGFMYFWDVKLNMVSSIALVISIGFAVDYSAHMCHTFTHCEGDTRDLRVIESLVLMGNPVFHGAMSTFLGVLLLGFSESYIFNVFFKMMVMVIVFGAIHGVVLLPVLLSLIGPLNSHNDESLDLGEDKFDIESAHEIDDHKGTGSTEASDSDINQNSQQFNQPENGKSLSQSTRNKKNVSHEKLFDYTKTDICRKGNQNSNVSPDVLNFSPPKSFQNPSYDNDIYDKLNAEYMPTKRELLLQDINFMPIDKNETSIGRKYSCLYKVNNNEFTQHYSSYIQSNAALLYNPHCNKVSNSYQKHRHNPLLVRNSSFCDITDPLQRNISKKDTYYRSSSRPPSNSIDRIKNVNSKEVLRQSIHAGTRRSLNSNNISDSATSGINGGNASQKAFNDTSQKKLRRKLKTDMA